MSTDVRPDPAPEARPDPDTGRLIAVGIFALALLVGVGVLVLHPWSSGGGFLPSVTAPPARIDVDTPALRAAKAEAGIADCPAGGAHNQLPAVTLPCLGGGPAVRLNSLRGPLVLTVWADWCTLCRPELPWFQRLHERLGGQATVLGIDYLDPQTSMAMALLRRSGVTYPQVADTQQDLHDTRPPMVTYGPPVTVLVDATGAIVYQRPGKLTSYAELAGLVRQHLGLGA